VLIGSLIKKVMSVKDFLLDLIFPKECLSCKQSGTYLCQSCFKKIEFNIKKYCPLCKKDLENINICKNCQEKTYLDNIWVSANYNNQILQDLIHCYKYQFIEELSSILSGIMIKYILDNNIFINENITQENTIIIDIPLHKKRYLKRGFNQSDLLARDISNHFSIDKFNLLKRKKNTVSQINLKRSERQENIKDAFVINSNNISSNKKIIIIDDVITTGSTLNECAKVLAGQGFAEIYGLVIAQRMIS